METMHINGNNHASAVLMLERQFEDRLLVECLAQMRERGIDVRVVSTTQRLVRSELGLKIEPDSCIDEVSGNGGAELVLLPGREGCVKRLLADPRVYQYVEKTLGAGGRLAVSSRAEAVVRRSGLLRADTVGGIDIQGGREAGEFARDLRDYLQGGEKEG
jgi:putative intracellular protease/amidase